MPSQKKSLKCTDGNLVRKMTGMAYVYQWYATVNLGTIRFTASSLLRCCKIWNQERIRMINNLMYIELKWDILMMIRHGLDMSKLQKVE